MVNPRNAAEIVAQWCDVHGLRAPAATETVDGCRRQVWRRPDGADVIESWTVPGMAHGAPLATRGEEACGVPGPFALDVGISSSGRIARFLGLTAPPDADRPAAGPPRPGWLARLTRAVGRR